MPVPKFQVWRERRWISYQDDPDCNNWDPQLPITDGLVTPWWISTNPGSGLSTCERNVSKRWSSAAVVTHVKYCQGAMQHLQIPRTRASLLQPEGEGCSGRQQSFSGGRPLHSTPNRRIDFKVLSQYREDEYQRGEGRAATKQQRRTREQYDYDFPPPPGTSPAIAMRVVASMSPLAVVAVQRALMQEPKWEGCALWPHFVLGAEHIVIKGSLNLAAQWTAWSLGESCFSACCRKRPSRGNCHLTSPRLISFRLTLHLDVWSSASAADIQDSALQALDVAVRGFTITLPAAGTAQQPPKPPNRPPEGPGGPEEQPSNFKNYLIAGAFFIGIGTGVWFDSGASFTPSNVASTEIVDRKTPNSEICMASGYSSMVFDQRLFVSFNPWASSLVLTADDDWHRLCNGCL